MKKLVLSVFALSLFGVLQAQQKQGRVLYEQRITLAGEIDGRPVPIKFRPGNSEVFFANDQSLIKQLPKKEELDIDTEGGVSVRIDNPASNQMTFTNLKTGMSVLSQEVAEKKYLIYDTINKLSWTLSEETKLILGRKCLKATTKRKSQLAYAYGISSQEGVEEIVTVWYAPSIPVAAGPDLQGQLPGVIMEINIDNGKVVYTAVELDEKIDPSQVKEPVAGTKTTREEFARICAATWE
ncbi:GLPGLI family protein [Pseudoflavitalea rhizosphaerae]|uniref:GLPGLI family protein n=1 Tax=Pseudoflavitalea rhizosphaerae TaxID=1884793 RepID=UPI0013E0C161|nr:GLPGLI family protein [Pseudoflavitalea rhizosphaerae]